MLEVLWIFLLSNIFVKLFFGANLSEFVGPNKTIIGIFERPIICMTPLSIVTAWSNLDANAVTKAGHDRSDFNSGNKAAGTWFLIFSIICSWFFSIKKTGILFLIKHLLAKEINL